MMHYQRTLAVLVPTLFCLFLAVAGPSFCDQADNPGISQAPVQTAALTQQLPAVPSPGIHRVTVPQAVSNKIPAKIQQTTNKPVIVPIDSSAPITVAQPVPTNTARPVITPKIAKNTSNTNKPQVRRTNPVDQVAVQNEAAPEARNEFIVAMDPPTSNQGVSNGGQDQEGMISRALAATQNLINHAVSWVGTRYVWGGTSRHGVDCSGLTRILYGTQGVNLPHQARQQFKHGQVVAKGQLLPGDLVFFNTHGPITHVGLYIGDGKFLHASNPRRGVRIDSLNAPYYNHRFAGARRYKKYDLA